MNTGFQERINSIAELLVENSKKSVSNINIVDNEKDSISKTISDALSKLNDEGQEIALKELKAIAIYDNTNDIIDGFGNINIEEIQKIAVNVVTRTIEENERAGIDVRAIGQSQYAEKNMNFVESAFDLAIATQIINNFSNESKENQDYAIRNMWNLPEEKRNNLLNKIENIVDESDKFSDKQKASRQRMIRGARTLKDLSGNEFLISNFLRFSVSSEDKKYVQDMLNRGVPKDIIRKYIDSRMKEVQATTLIEAKDQDGSIEANMRVDETNINNGIRILSDIEAQITCLNLSTDDGKANYAELSRKKDSIKRKILSDKREYINEQDKVKFRGQISKEDSEILTFRNRDLTEEQEEQVESLIKNGDIVAVDVYKQYKEDNFNKIKIIAQNILQLKLNIKDTSIMQTIDELKFSPEMILSAGMIPDLLKQQNLLNDANIDIELLTGLIGQSTEFKEMYATSDEIIQQSQQKKNETKSNEILVVQEISEMPKAFLAVNMKPEFVEDALSTFAGFLSDPEVQDRLIETDGIDNKRNEIINNLDLDKENLSDTEQILKAIVMAKFHGQIEEILSSSKKMNEFADMLKEAAQLAITPISQIPITDKELSDVVRGLSGNILDQTLEQENDFDYFNDKFGTTKKIDDKFASKGSDSKIDKQSAKKTKIEPDEQKSVDVQDKVDKVVMPKSDDKVAPEDKKQPEEITSQTPGTEMVEQDNSFIGKMKRVVANMRYQKEQDNKKGFFSRLTSSINDVFGNKKENDEKFYEVKDEVDTSGIKKSEGETSTKTQRQGYDMNQKFKIDSPKAVAEAETSAKAKNAKTTEQVNDITQDGPEQ